MTSRRHIRRWPKAALLSTIALTALGSGSTGHAAADVDGPSLYLRESSGDGRGMPWSRSYRLGTDHRPTCLAATPAVPET